MVVLLLREYKIRIDTMYELDTLVLALFTEHSDKAHSSSCSMSQDKWDPLELPKRPSVVNIKQCRIPGVNKLLLF